MILAVTTEGLADNDVKRYVEVLGYVTVAVVQSSVLGHDDRGDGSAENFC